MRSSARLRASNSSYERSSNSPGLPRSERSTNAFDRLDLDRWADEYKQRNGRVPEKGKTLWDVPKPPAFKPRPTDARSSTNAVSECASSGDLARLSRTKPKRGSRAKWRDGAKLSYSECVRKKLSERLRSGT